MPPTKKNKRSFDRKWGTVGEKARDVFDRWAEGSGRSFDEAEYTGACVRSHCVRDAHSGENSNFAGMEDSHREKHISASPCLVSWIAKTLW